MAKNNSQANSDYVPVVEIGTVLLVQPDAQNKGGKGISFSINENTSTGRKLLNIRVWNQGDSGNWSATRNGLALGGDLAVPVLQAIAQFLPRLLEEGKKLPAYQQEAAQPANPFAAALNAQAAPQQPAAPTPSFGAMPTAPAAPAAPQQARTARKARPF
jgi:hypothetical protein